MNKKVLFLTDIHLGSGTDSEARERDLVAFMDGVVAEVDTLVLLGDVFDFWFSYRYVVPRGFVRFIGKLAEWHDRGIAIHYFIGNHDMWVFDYFEREVGAKMYHEPTVLTLHGTPMLIGHGDGLDAGDRKYLFLKRMFHCRCNQRLFAFLPTHWAFGVAMAWSRSSRKKHPMENQAFRGEEQEDICQYVKRQLQVQPFRYAVFGHRHGAVECPLEIASPPRAAVYYNVGNWIERRDYALLDDRGVHLLQYVP